MQKNKGLTPSRKKEVRNPRKKYRNKHEKAEKRRAGGVMTMRSEETRYAGEKTGIRSTLSRGTKLH
jgi:U3 small nucleolar RNA-associated protein 3